MVVATTVKTAGGFVLPAETRMLRDKVSVTETFVEHDHHAAWSIVGRANTDGRIYAIHLSYITLEDAIKHHAVFYDHIHIYVADFTDDVYDFHKQEVEPAFDLNPWRHHQWFKDNWLRLVERLPRPSEKHPGLLSYFQTLDKRKRNIRTPIKPGRFLSKFFSDVLTETEIHELALEWSNKTALQEVKFTQDPDVIEDVYRYGPHSCMAFKDGGFSSPVHPARVYAGPDLAVAYLGPQDNASARAVVWPEKKVFGRLYGDESRLQASLLAQGYTHGDDDDFAGARLRRIEARWGATVVLPYQDRADRARDDGQYIILGEGYLTCDSTDGLAEGSEYSCDECGEGMDDDDRTYVDCADQDLCNHCLNRSFTYCHGLSEYRRDNEFNESIHGPHDNYSITYLESSDDWFYSEHSDKWFSTDDYDQIDTYEGSTVADFEVEEDGFYCIKLEQWTFETLCQINLTNGKSFHKDAFSSEEELAEWLAEHDYVVGQPEKPDPNQLDLPLAEAA